MLDDLQEAPWSNPITAAELKAIREKAGPHVEDEDWGKIRGTQAALRKKTAKLHRHPLYLTER